MKACGRRFFAPLKADFATHVLVSPLGCFYRCVFAVLLNQ